MNKKTVNNILIGLCIVFALLNTFPLGMVLALAFWIYLGVLNRKKKPLLSENIEPELVEKYLKRIKVLKIIAGISLPIAIVGIILHNVRSALSGSEEALFFFIGIIALYIFILASAGRLIVFLKGRQEPDSV